MPELTLDKARELVKTAIENDAYNWDNPDDAHNDEAVINIAGDLVTAVVQATKNNAVGIPVMEMSRVIGINPAEMSDATRQAYEARFGKTEATNGNAALPSEEAPEATLSGQASSDSHPEESGSSSAPDISAIFPGYDDMKAAEIKKAILINAASGDLSEEEWDQIKAYEEANEDRKTIRTLQPEFKQPEPEPTPEPEPQPQPMASSEDNGASRAAQEGLPLPQKVDFAQTPPILPINITGTSDQELSEIGVRFHSCFAYAQWLLSQEEGRREKADHLEHESHHDAYVQAFEIHKSQIPADKVTSSAVDNARKMADKDADGAAKVREYRSAKVQHDVDARELKALAAGYDKAVWRIDKELDRRARLATNARAT